MSNSLPAHRSPLTPFFNPSGVAVIGASADPRKLSHGVLRNCFSHGYAGAVHPVNPRVSEILGLPCYPDIEVVPDPVELAVLMVPAAACPDVLAACGRRGIKAAIVISGGFREVGVAGLALEQELLRIAGEHGMRLIGPNCVGTLDAHTGLNTTFIRTMPKPGPIAFVSQSGAICGGILEWTAGKGIGFSRFATLGNAADVSETDLLADLADDPHTRVIVAYVEAIRDGRRFIDVARRITPHKPILVIKAGRTQAGTRAVSSHTGSLAGEMAAYDAAFRQAGVIRVDAVEDLFDHALALAYGPLPRGPRVAVVTNAGGPASLAADALEQAGLVMPPMPEATRAVLAKFTHPEAQLGNPVDMLGGAEPAQYEQAVAALLAGDAFDAVLPILVPQALVDPVAVAEAIGRAAAGGSRYGEDAYSTNGEEGSRYGEDAYSTDGDSPSSSGRSPDRASPGDRPASSGKPVVACFMGDEVVRQPMAVLHEHQIASYIFPEQAARALGALWRYTVVRGRLGNWEVDGLSGAQRTFLQDGSQGRFTVHELLAQALANDQTQLGEAEARPILAAYGIAQPRAELARSGSEAGRLAGEIGFPVALKIVSPDIFHKSEVGGIALKLGDQAAVLAAFEAMLARVRERQPGARIEGVLVAQMATPGHEMIVGMRRDPQFGPLLMFGLGGIYVELLKDVAFRIAPFSRAETLAMIAETHAGKLLAGLRGQLPADIDAVAEVIERVAQLALDHPQIQEIDVNPLVAYPAGQGALAVDVRMMLA
ncbi:MAG TPA: acetate--CoA ligase family protein [Anaerolineae bacterium]|nr:acetate--CoA ligase family protein [Anaerolineae bacterium]